MDTEDLCEAINQLHDISELIPVDREEDLTEWLEHLEHRNVLTERGRQELKDLAEKHMGDNPTIAHRDLRNKLRGDARFLDIMGLN